MRISDWSSDVCSSDLICDSSFWPTALAGVDVVIHLAAIIPPTANRVPELATAVNVTATAELVRHMVASPTAKRLILASSMGVAGLAQHLRRPPLRADEVPMPVDHSGHTRSEEHTSELQSLLRTSSAVFCL